MSETATNRGDNDPERYLVANLSYMAQLLKDHPIPVNLNKLVEDAKKVSR